MTEFEFTALISLSFLDHSLVTHPIHRVGGGRTPRESLCDMTNRANRESGNHFDSVSDPQESVHEELRPSVGIEHLVQQLKETADKLIRDQANRGDVKLLSTALKELRYAFKVFSPYRHRRKVTVFGSARLPATHPAYLQAVEFSRAMAEAGFMVITGAASGIMEAGQGRRPREIASASTSSFPSSRTPMPSLPAM